MIRRCIIGGAMGLMLAAVVTITLPHHVEAQWSAKTAQVAVVDVKDMLAKKPLERVRDSVVAGLFIAVLERMSWKDEDLYTLGATLVEKDDRFFLGHLLKGFYQANVATDRRGHAQARDELKLALELWPVAKWAPHRGNMDALTSTQYLSGVSVDQQILSYYLTHEYLQLHYQLCEEHMELNEAREAWLLIDGLWKKDFAYDFFSQHKMAWMFYKYRYFSQGDEFPFLKASLSENVQTALRLSFQQKQRIAAYRALKYTNLRWWLDDGLLTWYESTADNVISLCYSVIWEVDSSITYFERIPFDMQIRNNGIYTYLTALNYRSAERQFELTGKPDGRPLPVVEDPTAIESYKNMLIYKGVPEEAYIYLDNYPKKYQVDRGWSRIWMGTINYWNGHLDEALRNLRTAHEYPEVFANISFNRTHYDMMALIQMSVICQAQVERLRFEPNLETGFFARIWGAVKTFVMKLYYGFMAFVYRHWAINNYLEIEDRQEYLKVYYSENVMDYFQTWSIVKHLDPAWHLDRLQRARAADPRERAGKFYRVFEAGFLHQAGDDEGALRVLDAGPPITTVADTTYEKLLMAMSEDLQIAVRSELGRGDVRDHILTLYRIYPQAILLWGHRLPLRFEASSVTMTGLTNEQRDYADEAISVFRDFGFDFTEAGTADEPAFSLRVTSENGRPAFQYTVTMNGGVFATGVIATEETQAGSTVTLTPQDVALRLAYAVFRLTPHHLEGEPRVQS